MAHDEVLGEWHFRARLKRHASEWSPPDIRYIGFAKRGPFVTEDCGMDEPGPIWFDFGPTAEAVLTKLKSEVLH